MIALTPVPFWTARSNPNNGVSDALGFAASN